MVSVFTSSNDLICAVMVSVFTLSVVDHQFEPWSDQTKDYKIDIFCSIQE